MNRLAVLIAAGFVTGVGLVVATGWQYFIDKPSAVQALRDGIDIVTSQPEKPLEKPSTVVEKPVPEQRQEKTVPKKRETRKQKALPMVKAPQAPSFDVVRVEPNGSAVLAGRAAPNALVDILVDGEVAASVQADESGAWTYVPDKPLFTGSHALSLRAHRKGKTVKAEQVLTVSMQPVQRGGIPLVLLATPDAPTRVLQKPAPTKTVQTKMAQAESPKPRPPRADSASPQTPRQAAANTAGRARTTTAKPDETEATEKAKNKNTRPAPAPARPLASARTQPRTVGRQRTLVLSTVDYDENGRIFFTGRATAGAALRLYVDNRYLADVRASETGAWEWRGTASIPAGRHALRVDRLAPDGRVIERIELPFVREDVRRLAEARAAAGDATLKRKLAQGRAGGPDAASPAADGRRMTAANVHQEKGGKQAKARKNATLASRQEERSVSTTDKHVQGGLAATVAQVAPRAPLASAPAPRTAPAASAGVRKHPDAMRQTPSVDKASGTPGTGFIIVQPGNNLWNISRVVYGEGVRYTTIYEANRDQIRDPDLIYPGQVFKAPGLPPKKLSISPDRRTPLSPQEIEGAPPAEKTTLPAAR